MTRRLQHACRKHMLPNIFTLQAHRVVLILDMLCGSSVCSILVCPFFAHRQELIKVCNPFMVAFVDLHVSVLHSRTDLMCELNLQILMRIVMRLDLMKFLRFHLHMR